MKVNLYPSLSSWDSDRYETAQNYSQERVQAFQIPQERDLLPLPVLLHRLALNLSGTFSTSSSLSAQSEKYRVSCLSYPK